MSCTNQGYVLHLLIPSVQSTTTTTNLPLPPSLAFLISECPPSGPHSHRQLVCLPGCLPAAADRVRQGNAHPGRLAVPPHDRPHRGQPQGGHRQHDRLEETDQGTGGLLPPDSAAASHGLGADADAAPAAAESSKCVAHVPLHRASALSTAYSGREFQRNTMGRRSRRSRESRERYNE